MALFNWGKKTPEPDAAPAAPDLRYAYLGTNIPAPSPDCDETTVLAETVIEPVAAPVIEPIDIPVAAPVAPVAAVESITHQEKPASTWLVRLKQGLSRTGTSLSSLFIRVKVDEALFEELEEALLMADAGVEATQWLLQKLREHVKQNRIEDSTLVKQALRQLVTQLLTPLEATLDLNQASPMVMMIAGVNGAGKTTSIGKLAKRFQAQNKTVLLAAGDTFRAAARQQLAVWGERNGVTVIAQESGDPAAVAFDAVASGKARQMNIVMIDTAGRLATQLHLMDELKKIKRVLAKADAAAPHQVLLVVDGNTGQNALAQIKAFDDALGLTGLIVTKLDGTAKGGTLCGLAKGSRGLRPIPVYYIGVGEGIDDLQPFVAAEFAQAMIG